MHGLANEYGINAKCIRHIEVAAIKKMRQAGTQVDAQF
jgi:DNA-directed RNA polymerase sigma subunit (sigma70/sigma32)